MNTTGFKKSRAEFEDLIYSNQKDPGQASGLQSISPTGVQTGLGVRTASIQKDFAMGQTAITSNPLDFQIEGNGFFQVRTPDGEIAYTRDGSFRKDASGRVADKNGNTLIPELVIPESAMVIEATPSGEIRVIHNASSEPEVIGQFEIANFINPAGLKSIGKNLFTTSPASGQPSVARPGTQGMGYLAQNQLETSNVNIVDEMINMISAQRAYETNSKVVQTSDQMLQTAVNVK